MKKILHFLLLLLLPVCVNAQNQLKQTKIHAENVQLRLPESTVFDSISIEVPDSGKVTVIFDGNCTSTVDDRIILAANQIDDWDTNDGNTWTEVFDPLHNTACFRHSRVFTVVPGTHTFYAVGQNYVRTGGTGMASVDGRLTVIYVPDYSFDEHLNGLGYSDSGLIWVDSVKVFQKTTIVAPVKGQIEVAFDGYVYMNDWETGLFTTNLSSAWPDHVEITSVNMSDEHYYGPFLHRKIYDVEAGTYEINALGKKTFGDLNSNNDGIYSTLTAHFIPDDNPHINLKSEVLDNIEITNGIPEILGQIQIEVTQPGTATIECTGHLLSSLDDKIHLSLRPHGRIDSIINALIAQPLRESNPSTYFSLSGSQVVQDGTHTFDVIAEFDPKSSGTGAAEISGLFNVLYLADQVTTAVEDRITTKQEELFYPNPTTGILYNHKTTDIGNQRVINVFNTNGQLLEQIIQQPGQQQINIDHLANGTYVLRMQKENSESIQMIIKAER